LELPVFGFGAAHIGDLYAKVDEADSRATLNAAWDAGVRYYDTAPWYGRGLSEHRLGGFLRTKPRAEFQVTSKVGRTLHRPKDPRPSTARPGRAASISRSISTTPMTASCARTSSSCSAWRSTPSMPW
jgi:D-threo-aldose 1-dehydrogenase